MTRERDRKAFLDALEKIPDDVMGAKFEGRPPGGSTRRAGKRKCGASFDRTLDLHGFTRREALLSLQDLLHSSKGKSHRILVITGRGNRSENNRGVIREAVRSWLEKAGTLDIRDFRTAAPENGGDGAVEIITR